MNRTRRMALAAGVLLLVAGVTVVGVLWFGQPSMVDSDQLHIGSQRLVSADGESTLGQTFVARHAGLSGVEFWLAPEAGEPLAVTLHLRSDALRADDLLTTSVSLPAGSGAGFYPFAFGPQPRSHGQYYYAFLEIDTGSTMAGLSDGTAYLDGTGYLEHAPLDAQTAFRLVYSRSHIFADLVLAALRGVGLLAIAGLLLIVPGWALLVWLWPGRNLTWISLLILAAGIGLGLYPLLFAWTGLLGWRLGFLHAVLPAAAGLLALGWHYRTWRPRRALSTLRVWFRSEALWPDVTLVLLGLLVIGTRFVAVRTLDAPMWGDSYQHSVITQLLVDNGGLFNSWEPYAALDSFTYHFGFHAFSSVFHWLSGTEIAESVLLAGQMTNILAVLALYPLAVRLSSSRWAGVLAVLVAGLLSPMPMFYANWGRYTQLAGQAILPMAMVVAWAALESKARNWRLLALSGIAISGLAMTHYRIVIFFVIFVGAWSLLAIRRSNWRRSLSRVAGISLAGSILFLPWFAQAFAGRILGLFWQRLTTPVGQLSAFDLQHNTVGELTTYLPSGIWLLLAVAVGVGLWQRRRGVLFVSLWWFLLFVITNPEQLQLPGSGIISNFSLFIAWYLPAGLLIGDLGSQLCSVLEAKRWRSAAVAMALAIVGLVAAPTRLEDVQPEQHALVTRPDRRAMAWIRENTPEDSLFLVNSFLAYDGAAVVGSDAGWWLPLLANRSNTVPPINYGMESWSQASYGQQVQDLSGLLVSAEPDDSATLALLRQYAVTHLYIGQRQGRVNYGGPSVLDPQELERSAHYRPVYHQDRVWVFAVSP